MKTIGLIGGMSWESTVTYYQILNETVQDELGGLHSAKCILFSVDFNEIERCQANGEWEKSAAILIHAAQSLERAGAEYIVLCTNTMHKIAPEISAGVSIPFLHIAEMTALELTRAGIKRAGLLGTMYTMEQDFYKKVLQDHGIDVLIPDERSREAVHTIIYTELCRGIISPQSKKRYLQAVNELSRAGAEGIILGCTEIGLLIHQDDTPVPLFDTTRIHARAAALRAMGRD